MRLRPHQEKAVADIMEPMGKWGLAMLSGETRTGKTLVSFEVAHRVGGDFLVVTKKSAIPSIKADWEEVGGGDQMQCINFESVHKVKVGEGGIDLIVIDECHYGISGYPKQSKAWKGLNELFLKTKAKALLMSGTVALESRAQLYHEMNVTCRGPFIEFATFYDWWNPPEHYKVFRQCGAFGQYGASKRIGMDMEVVDYAKVQDSKVEKAVAPYVVTMTREEACYQVLEAKVIPIKLNNSKLSWLVKKLTRDKVLEVTDIDGGLRTCVYDGPAQVLQGCHMLAGGTLIDDEGEAFVLGMEYEPFYRANWIREGMQEGKKYAILTNYIKERELLLSFLGDLATDSLEELKETDNFRCFVGSLSSNAEGVDMHWLTGSQILYSLNWSGSKFSQVCDRQLNFFRKEEAKVAVPMLEGGVDEAVLDAVRGKTNFNASFYRAMK